MAVIDSNQTVSSNKSGFDKKIHASATTMMLDNLQATMYNRPFDSAVRESVSNAVDSVKEKNIAKKILKGEVKVSDYYLTQEDVKDKIANKNSNIYEDSEFKRDYYDLKWLDDNDTVSITYINTEQTARDKFIIKDPGVGLGGSRLSGYFSLGYSTKRLNTNELGGFGIGAKSPLATGVESFRMTSRHNGKEFCFDIYSHKVDCVYSKWNEDGSINDSIEFKDIVVGEENGQDVYYKAFYKNTLEKNGVTLEIEVKKHNRQKYFEAVKSQLMYLKESIKFYEVNIYGQTNEISFKANIIYEDDNIILTDYNYYSRPHFVIKNVGYGIIDFNELDLSQKHGNIGIKVKMEDIQVTPSRESVIYSTKTRDAVLKQYDKVSNTVESTVEASLNQDNLLDWIRACNNIMYSQSNSSDVVSRLSSLIDKSSLKPKFKGKLNYNSDVKQFITPVLHMKKMTLTSNYDYKKSKHVKKLVSVDADNIVAFNQPIYLQFIQGVSRVTTYLGALHERNSGFCTIRTGSQVSYLDDCFQKYVTNKVSKEQSIIDADLLISTTEPDSKKRETIIKNTKYVFDLLESLLISNDVKVYSESLVPDNYKPGDIGDDSDVEIDQSVDFEAIEQKKREDAYKETLQRRKENKIFIANTLCNKKITTYNFEPGFERKEIKVADLDFVETKVVYGTDEDIEIFELLMKLETRKITNRNVYTSFYWNEDIKMLKVAKNNVRYLKKEGMPVKDYALKVDSDGCLTSCEIISDAFTAAAIKHVITTSSTFMRNFGEFSTEISQDYSTLVNFAQEQSDISSFNNDNSICKTLKAAYNIQLQLLLHPSLTEDEKQELIDNTLPKDLDLDVTDVDLINIELFNKAVKLAAFTDTYGCIFKHIGPLTDKTNPILEPELAVEIRNIIEAKKDRLEYQYENIN